jgi:hypothetical protein
MDEEKIVNKLVQKARLHKPPNIDVSESVMRTLNAKQREDYFIDNSLEWLAAFSVLTACSVAVLAFLTLQNLIDPFMGIILDISWKII